MKTLENIQTLLQLLAQYTSLISGEEYMTLSAVVPAVLELNLHLEQMKKVAGMVEPATTLLTELKRRFRKFTDPTSLDHDPLFLAATALDPRYRVLLNPSQKESARKELLKRFKDNQESTSSASSSGTESPLTITLDAQEGGPPKKRFRLLSTVLEQKRKGSIKLLSKQPPGEQEVCHYLNAVHSVSDRVDPIIFWIEQEQTYPQLSLLAIDILMIPGSSAPVECIFSTAGESTNDKKNRLSDSNLEREVLSRKNKNYL